MSTETFDVELLREEEEAILKLYEHYKGLHVNNLIQEFDKLCRRPDTEIHTTVEQNGKFIIMRMRADEVFRKHTIQPDMDTTEVDSYDKEGLKKLLGPTSREIFTHLGNQQEQAVQNAGKKQSILKDFKAENYWIRLTKDEDDLQSTFIDGILYLGQNKTYSLHILNRTNDKMHVLLPRRDQLHICAFCTETSTILNHNTSSNNEDRVFVKVSIKCGTKKSSITFTAVYSKLDNIWKAIADDAQYKSEQASIEIVRLKTAMIATEAKAEKTVKKRDEQLVIHAKRCQIQDELIRELRKDNQDLEKQNDQLLKIVNDTQEFRSLKKALSSVKKQYGPGSEDPDIFHESRTTSQAALELIQVLEDFQLVDKDTREDIRNAIQCGVRSRTTLMTNGRLHDKGIVHKLDLHNHVPEDAVQACHDFIKIIEEEACATVELRLVTGTGKGRHKISIVKKSVERFLTDQSIEFFETSGNPGELTVTINPKRKS